MFTAKDLQAAEQLRRALQMVAANLSPTLAREVAMVYPAYQAGKKYAAGDYITDGADCNGDPILYSVVQAHTSAEEWPPAATPSLYTPISLDETGFPIWSQPSGSHDAYNTGNITYHEPTGKLWRSKIDGNTTEPGTDDRWWEIYEVV